MQYKPAQYTLYQLLEIFPEAKPYVKRKLKQEIKDGKAQLEEIVLLEREYKKVTSKIYRDRWFFEMVVELVYLPDRKEIFKKIKQNTFYLSALKPKTATAENVKGVKITEEDTMRAKQISITNFLEVNKSGFAKCPFHKDNHASLKVYEKENRWHCFGACGGKGGDVIDLIQKMRNLDFHSAVKYLIGK